MDLYGGMSKGERNRIKIRVRSAMAAQAATEGRLLGRSAALRLPAGRRRHASKPEQGGDRSTPPPARTRPRQPRRSSNASSPSTSAERASTPSPESLTAWRHSLPFRPRPGRGTGTATAGRGPRERFGRSCSTPSYTGRQVWNRQSRDEVLIDVEDVAGGHETRMRWNDRSAWIWSSEQTHQALVSSEDFAAVQAQMAVHGRQSTRKPRAVNRPYSLSGLIWCARCGRRMQGNWNHDAPHYRCRYGSEYALANQVDHPKTVYVKEVGHRPRVRPMARPTVRPGEPGRDDRCAGQRCRRRRHRTTPRVAAARKKLVDCDDRLDKYRAALDSGADPVVVAGWLDEVRAERAGRRGSAGHFHPDVAAVRGRDSPSGRERSATWRRCWRTPIRAAKAAIYADLGVTTHLRPRPAEGRGGGPANRCANRCVSEGGLEPPRPCGHQPLKLARLPIPPLRRGRPSGR